MKELEEDNIDQVILDIGNKLTGQEIWYWESLVHLYREYKRRFENLTKEHADTITRNEDYRERIDKAINKIQYIIDYGFDYDGFDNEKDLKGLIDMLVKYAEESKNILRGEDKE